jgi:apolipoprotein N-acyltransferase
LEAVFESEMKIIKVKQQFQKLALTLVSVACVALSFHPADLNWLAWFALAPLLLALRQASAWQATGQAFVFGYLHGIVVFWWLAYVEGVGFPVYLLLLAPIYSIYYTVFGFSYRWASARLQGLMLFLTPALWISIEYTRANMFFLSLPWNLLGHTQHAVPTVIGIADLTGVYGVSFLLVLANEALSRWLEFVLQDRKRSTGIFEKRTKEAILPTTVAVLILLLAFGWSLARNRTTVSTETVRIGLVQPNIVLTDGMSFEDRQTHLKIYEKFTRRAAEKNPDLILWPASSLPGPLNSRPIKILLGPLIQDLDSALLVGGAGGQKMAPAEGDRRSFANVEFLIRSGGRQGGRYAKQRLVPFNEYLPLDGSIRWPRWITTLKGSYRPGDQITLFNLKGAKFGVPICWESLFPDLFRRFVKEGADFMVNVTNEAYMGDTAGPYQTHAMNVFRAVENRVALARVSATGISAFIGPDGRVLDTVKDANGKQFNVPGIIVRDIPLSKERTFYTMHGDIFAWSMIVISILFLAVSPRFGSRGEA